MSGNTTTDAPRERELLPSNAVPSHYDVSLQVDLPKFKFDGEETVTVTLESGSKAIVLHAVDIAIDVASLKLTTETTTRTGTDVTYDKDTGVATLVFGDEELPAGEARLSFRFTGELNDNMVGFYRSRYELNGETKYMATTQFEPVDARRAFPCWDEPALKATFSIALTVPRELTALGNMPVASSTDVEVDGAPMKTVVFEKTPRMSTYLVAMIVGEFDHVEGETAEGVKVRVYTLPGLSDQGKFALDCAVKILSYYTEYFNIPYVLPKCDMVAIADFSAGAMENWGLVTYRETALLIDEKNSGVASRQRVAYVVAHELAHQWFGNLCTMLHWDDLFLNEAAATFFGVQATDFLFPEWNMWTSFVTDYVSRAQDLDALESSHPIHVEVFKSEEIDEIFDAISYCKGATVVRMIANYLGESNFRQGVSKYVKAHEYANAVSHDLWAALGEASGEDVPTLLDRWTHVTGYPVLEVTRERGLLQLKQQRFLSSGERVADTSAWWLPITIVDGEKTHKYTFDKLEGTLDIPEFTDSEWIKLNAEQSGMFRVAYDSKMVPGLKKALADGALAATDRIGLQNDATALAKAGYLATSDMLSLMLAYRGEREQPVIADLATNIARFARVWAGEPNVEKVHGFVREVFADMGEFVGWDAKDGESDLVTLVRPTVLSMLAAFGHEATRQEAFTRFAKHVAGEAELPADLRSMVYGAVCRSGTVEQWEQVLNIYRTAEMHAEKIRALGALGRTHDVTLVQRVLDMSLSDKVRAQDTFYLFASCGAHPVGLETTWNFLVTRWDKIEERFSTGSFLLGRIIQYASAGFTSNERANEVESFFASKSVPSATRTIQQSLESIRAKAAWLDRARNDVASFLDARD